MMTTQEFLDHKKLALIRLSAQAPVMGVKMNEELAKKGYAISVVHLNPEAGAQTIADVGPTVEGAIIAVPRNECAAAVREAIDAGIPRLWLQSGCDSEEAIALCRAESVPVIHHACVLMYAQPVESIHGFHRRIWKLIGKLQE